MTMSDNTQDPTVRTIEPCEHMVNAVNGLADGTLKGPMKAYTKLHTLHCAKCRTALSSLTILHTRLGALSASEPADGAGLSLEHQAVVESAMDDIEKGKIAGK